MVAKLQKWGNSLGIRIPKAFADELHLEKDSELEMIRSHEKITLIPVRKKKKLSDMLKNIENENRHPETDTGERIGKEEW